MDYLEQMKQTQQELAQKTTQKEFAVSKDIKGNGVNNIFRIASLEHAKCERSWIVCDDGVIRPFTLIDHHGNKSPLLKLLGDPANFYRGGILESVKDEITKKGTYKYKDEYPELITRLGYQGDRINVKGNAKLQKNVLYNIIDRDLYEGTDDKGNKYTYYWCKENEHTMLLWLKTTAFDTLISTVEGNGDPTEYDCTYTKVGSNTSTTHVIQKAGDKLSGVVIGYLTDEEKAYARYDVFHEARLTPAGLVLHYLQKLIQDLDMIFGYNVLDELKEVAALERAEQSDSEEVEGSTGYETEEEESAEVPQSSNPKPAPQPTPQSQPESAPAPTPTRGTPVRGAAKPAANTVPCGYKDCGRDVPVDAIECPHCKRQLQAPCDNPDCGKYFSVFSMQCPHCGQEYGNE